MNLSDQKSLSLLLASAASGAAIATLAASVATAFFWFHNPESVLAFFGYRELRGYPVLLPRKAWLALPLVFFALAAALFVALLRLARMFRCFASHEPLTVHTAHAVRKAGLAFFAFALLLLLSQPAITWLLTHDNPAGQRLVAIAFGVRDLLGLLMAGVLVATGRLLAFAAVIRDDHRQIV